MKLLQLPEKTGGPVYVIVAMDNTNETIFRYSKQRDIINRNTKYN